MLLRIIVLSVLVLSTPAWADPSQEICGPDKVMAQMKACPEQCSDPTECLCDPDKFMKQCPLKSFAVIESPTGRALTLTTHEPFALHSECAHGKGGISCTAWPQEQEQGANLRYEWTFETRDAKLTLADTTSPWSQFACKPGEYVVAALTVDNGAYRAASKKGLRCDL